MPHIKHVACCMLQFSMCVCVCVCKNKWLAKQKASHATISQRPALHMINVKFFFSTLFALALCRVFLWLFHFIYLFFYFYFFFRIAFRCSLCIAACSYFHFSFGFISFLISLNEKLRIEFLSVCFFFSFSFSALSYNFLTLELKALNWVTESRRHLIALTAKESESFFYLFFAAVSRLMMMCMCSAQIPCTTQPPP